MPSHARPKPSRVPRSVLRAGLVISAAGAAMAGGAAASAAPAHGSTAPRVSVLDPKNTSLTAALKYGSRGGLGPVKDIRLDPMNNTGVDPLANAVGTRVADFKPVSTAQVTGPVTNGGTLRTLPVTGQVMRTMPG
ncbi:hypothetical protein GCM10010211_62710 [Streptomyces albospinus]|uniref:Uncharacterized protein n=1 Tax=Streptomyces albospinus TaxID=285515 RepID=A0ABQ2VJZ1_9ACTN|nr:hypothetical protein [Streptomyces albospinus]GGU87891.1 hypothetical protein GCM10010211_62710 [Streptomyces albospinus]